MGIYVSTFVLYYYNVVALYTGRYIPYTVAHHNSLKTTVPTLESRFYVLAFYSTQLHGTMFFCIFGVHCTLKFHILTYVRTNFFT